MSTSSVNRVADRYMNKGEWPSNKQAATDKAPSPETFLNLSQFYIAYEAFRLAVKATETTVPPKLITSGDKWAKKKLFDVAAGIEEQFVPVASDIRALTDIKRSTRGAELERAVNIGYSLRRMYPKARKKDVLKQMFGKHAEFSKKLAVAVESDDPLSRLNAIAGLPATKGQALLRRWIMGAATALGVEPTETEQVMASASAAQSIGRDLREVDGQIRLADPGSAEHANLNEQRIELLNQIEETAATSPRPDVVFTAAAVESTKNDQYSQVTEIGRQLKMSEEQEAAMMITGKGLIAAGAGSGKTRVLAGKVVDTIQRLGASSNQIVATSFSKKSAAELIRRVKEYGGDDILSNGNRGFGTTHSIGLALIKEFAPDLATTRTEINDGGYILKMAMAQVQMDPDRNPGAPPAPKGMFDGLYGTRSNLPPSATDLGAQEEIEEEEQSKLSPEMQVYADTLFAMEDLAQWGAGNRYGWAFGDLKILSPIIDARKTPDQLSQREKAQLNKLISMGRYQRSLQRNGLDPNYRFASVHAREAARKGQKDKNYYWDHPANQFFNLGVEKFEDERGLAIGPKRFSTAISKYRANLMTPSQAWDQDKSNYAAVYAAYVWLKENDPQNADMIDFDDMLEKACQVLVANPKALARVQARFKHILVDEAQDLNKAQHLLFGLLAGHVDPRTQKPFGDGRMTAETFVFIGDDKQCVAEGSLVDTPDGSVEVERLEPGASVISYRNGVLVAQTVRHCVRSNWDWGFKITTESGHTLTMSPNHKLWATEPQTEEGQVAVYLMHRKDMGFRIGITNKGKVGSEGEYLNSYGGRCFLEKADRLWIVDVCKDLDDALLQEQVLSLHYGIPTQVFNGEHRGLSQARLNAIFKQFGRNGAKLLEERNLSFNLPHWMAQSYTKHGRKRHTINLTAHGSSNTHVSLEWSGGKWDDVLTGRGINKTADDRRRLRRWFANYREALAYAEEIAKITDAQVSQRLSIPDGPPLRKITAAGLFAGMQVPVRNEHTIVLDRIISVEKVTGLTFYDLDVDDASNFFAGNVLTSNSIYEFRGATPGEFIEKSDLGEGTGEFKTKVIERNWRSGKNIVDAANKLIAHNDKQIPMTCTTNPQKGEGSIFEVPVATHEAGAELAANEIQQLTQGEGAMMTYDEFGVAVRTNAEAYAFGVEMIQRGIPFRSKINFFNDETTKALVYWLQLAGSKDKKTVNNSVLNAHRAPKFWLDRTFNLELQKEARGRNYLEFLHDGGWEYIYKGRADWKNRKNVLPYTENLWRVSQLRGSPEEILQEILQLKGAALKDNPVSLIDALIARVKGSQEAIDMLAEEAQGGEITDEAIRGLALAPIQPLLGLLKGYEDLGPALDYVAKLQTVAEQKAKKDNPEAEDYKEPAVVIDTCHGWKGLEVSHIYVPMAAGVFPHSLSEEDEEQMASERRLAYVALTRGKDAVTVISPRQTHMNKPGGTSRFVTEACIRPEGVDDNPDTPAPPRNKKGHDLRRRAFLELLAARPTDELIEAWGETD